LRESPFGYKRSDKYFEVRLKAERFGLEENKGGAFNLET